MDEPYRSLKLPLLGPILHLSLLIGIYKQVQKPFEGTTMGVAKVQVLAVRRGGVCWRVKHRVWLKALQFKVSRRGTCRPVVLHAIHVGGSLHELDPVGILLCYVLSEPRDEGLETTFRLYLSVVKLVVFNGAHTMSKNFTTSCNPFFVGRLSGIS